MNIFGGKNPHGLYVPMSEDEQETLSRLIEGDYLEMGIENGPFKIVNTKFILGDLRLGIRFQLECPELIVNQVLSSLQLKLNIRNGKTLFSEEKEITPQVILQNGMILSFQWDIALHSISSDIVKEIKPGSIGLTSRRQDKDTREMTREGNMKLSSFQKKLLSHVEEGSARIREIDRLKKQ